MAEIRIIHSEDCQEHLLTSPKTQDHDQEIWHVWFIGDGMQTVDIHTSPPPAQNRYMQEQFLEELIFAQIHVGPVFA